ncbi:MAG TPA: non-homologous end-joining DNA ligase [Anaerolineales bacterium]|nr:non-homologous end-joining DNA ligase [Anaerolineales bacterium]
MSKTFKKIGGHKIEITNADKELFPDDGITKSEVVDYYQRIAETMLPHMKGRPLALQRFPDGIDEEGFYQKEAAVYFPDFIETVRITLEDGSKQNEIVCNNAVTLVYLANLAVITPHVWLSTTEAIRKPDKIVFDLDPSDDDFAVVKEGAHDLRKLLEYLGLTCFVMTTGSRGLHVACPIKPEHDYNIVKEFTKAAAQNLEAEDPKFTTKVRKEKRRGRVFVDYLRNEYAQTSVAPYALRPKPGAPVAAPLDWDELSESKLDPQGYTMENIFKRLGRKGDPWKDFARHRASLPAVDELPKPEEEKEKHHQSR